MRAYVIKIVTLNGCSKGGFLYLKELLLKERVRSFWKQILSFKETKSATMNIFRFFFNFLFKSFVKVELSYVFTINLFTIAENCTEK